MTNTVTVSGNKTLGEGDDGTVQCVDAAATVTLPHEDSWKFKKEDEFEIVTNTASTVKIAGEQGVTLTTSPTLSAKGGSIKVKYQGSNAYLVWSSLCIALVVGMLVYNYDSVPDSVIMLINWIE